MSGRGLASPAAFGRAGMYYNFVRIHTTLQTTPAWRDRGLWEMTDVVEALEVLEAWEN